MAIASYGRFDPTDLDAAQQATDRFRLRLDRAIKQRAKKQGRWRVRSVVPPRLLPNCSHNSSVREGVENKGDAQLIDLKSSTWSE